MQSSCPWSECHIPLLIISMQMEGNVMLADCGKWHCVQGERDRSQDAALWYAKGQGTLTHLCWCHTSLHIGFWRSSRTLSNLKLFQLFKEGLQSCKEYGMVHYVKGCRKVKQHKTDDLLSMVMCTLTHQKIANWHGLELH